MVFRPNIDGNESTVHSAHTVLEPRIEACVLEEVGGMWDGVCRHADPVVVVGRACEGSDDSFE